MHPIFINTEIFNELIIIDNEDGGFLESIIKIYLDQTFNSIDKLNDLITIKDFEECSKIGHMLKGSSSSIGLNDIALCGGRIEYLWKNQSINLAPEDIFTKFSIEFNLLEKNFKLAKDFLSQYIIKK